MRRDWFLLTVFCIAFAYIEAAIVVYLRYLSAGIPETVFPINEFNPTISIVEILREFMTIILLISIASITAREKWGRFFRFLFLFGMWDILYYVWLKILIGWPKSLISWDILFLIPVPWVGPVIAPVLVAILLVIDGIVFFNLLNRRKMPVIDPIPISLGILGAILVFFSFTLEQITLILKQGIDAIYGYMPQDFPWLIFILGWLLMFTSSWLFARSFRGVDPLSPGLEEPVT